MANVEILGAKPRVESIQSGIDPAARERIADSLGEILSATYSLLVKTHVHHWNVVGPLFHSLHEMLEEQYGELFQATDLFAERIRALGFSTPVPSISVQPAAREMVAEEIVQDLIADHEATVRTMRQAALTAEDQKDIVTHDMLVGRMEWHEKIIWMLRAVITK
ncbi:starvation-inducible DNA-binding protein [Rhodoblastus acidophilus]|uniref:Starvation-inducible DNA-binding protein n=1 Tax=Rhodoblastus acidophilus TaxID=1074 RepID=A0A212RPR4_RHOAC|nr:DNA starvation/stationary phase protection protein [Rhodoblastus acidophilus]MCW2316155.1 starvation-inducible DNA-binding protein [Rhodoblastus acidophilus]PPQ38504.1 DNA starvation/stationary phase protection protein [Rhodoblastus acidophilus]RAI21817.1 DNA starvation/stationary phase protection protein [Rhodoblastus acidophilus]SNB74540.1 starvation-inducible DNA-binding protein [Rhodoblastus acidophilus]